MAFHQQKDGLRGDLKQLSGVTLQQKTWHCFVEAAEPLKIPSLMRSQDQWINGAEDLSGERIVYSSGNGMFFMLSLHMIFLQKCKILRLSRNFFHDFPRTNYQAFPTKGLVTAPHIPTNWQPVIAHPVMILQTRRGHDGNRSRTWKALGRLLQGSQQLGMSENGVHLPPGTKKQTQIQWDN